MAKRFTATEIWDEDWFLEMPNNYKLFWYYMLAQCDHAGIFRVNIKKFQIIIRDKKVTTETALKYFNNGKNRIRILTENRWFIEDFFTFQYGSTLNKNSKVHESIENIYNQANINLTSIRGLKDLKDRVKDKDKDIKKGGVGENKKGAIKISDGFAYFDDGSKQELGDSQKFMSEQNQLKARDVKKGVSY